MTAPAGIIRDQVRQLIESQILLFVTASTSHILPAS